MCLMPRAHSHSANRRRCIGTVVQLNSRGRCADLGALAVLCLECRPSVSVTSSLSSSCTASSDE